MKEKPILFSTEMVKAIIAGNKTQTRRVIKPQPIIITTKECHTFSRKKCPYKIDQILWVRETFYIDYFTVDHTQSLDSITYWRADNIKYINAGLTKIKWKPSIFMPRKAARLFLKVKDIRIERIQDISIEDAKAEGCNCSWLIYKEGKKYHNLRRKTIYELFGTPVADTREANEKSEFAYLWNSINAKPKPKYKNKIIHHYESYPWDIESSDKRTTINGVIHYCYPNPYVWVYDFEVIK